MFPAFEQWCDEVLHPEDTQPWNFRTPEFYEEYRTKYAIAKLIKPERILEVGVRFGYAANSFLRAAPNATYFGLDFDEPSWGPYQGVPRLWAEQRLQKLYPESVIRTYKMDTQKETPEPFDQFDLVHIDADHSYEGALHDMQTFWPLCCNTMVVDDYREVALAVATFVCKHRYELTRFHVDSLRSSALLVRIQ